MRSSTYNMFIKEAGQIVGGQSALARLLGVSPPTVNQWASGKRPIPAHRCLAIERATGGLVKRGDLRADAHLIWPDVASPISTPAPLSREAPEALHPGADVEEGIR